jgi:hypothetical protein
MYSPLVKKNNILLTVKVNRIINDSMNKLKEILKEGWDVFPPWLWAGNIFCIVLALSVILFV